MPRSFITSMKKNRNIILSAAVAVAISLTAFSGQQQNNLKVELPVESWDVVLEVIDQSNAPHQQVKAVKNVLLSQLQEQVQADSTTQNQ